MKFNKHAKVGKLGYIWVAVCGEQGILLWRVWQAIPELLSFFWPQLEQIIVEHWQRLREITCSITHGRNINWNVYHRSRWRLINSEFSSSDERLLAINLAVQINLCYYAALFKDHSFPETAPMAMIANLNARPIVDW